MTFFGRRIHWEELGKSDKTFHDSDRRTSPNSFLKYVHFTKGTPISGAQILKECAARQSFGQREQRDPNCFLNWRADFTLRWLVFEIVFTTFVGSNFKQMSSSFFPFSISPAPWPPGAMPRSVLYFLETRSHPAPLVAGRKTWGWPGQVSARASQPALALARPGQEGLTPRGGAKLAPYCVLDELQFRRSGPNLANSVRGTNLRTPAGEVPLSEP